MGQDEYIHHHSFSITKEHRQALHGHKSFILWFTGLSGSGKSTIANMVEGRLHEKGVSTYILDGDNLRNGLNEDLGFSSEDRKENVRRIGEVAKIFVDSGIVVLATFISPYIRDREAVRKKVQQGEFLEIYVKCPLEACEKRDPKGLYKKARIGEITQFTGISAPYEEPVNPEIIIETSQYSIEECVQQIMNFLKDNEHLGDVNI
ncbi:adenylyl-sulfate kinase [Peribacillus frigoritolerans]|jgi:adenylylsulfate kinase|uniref:adenylyl-sulfate kinase n=1 Tax=Peribacillus frigoritolerans TaxID=450367 RepID=UPI0022827229|nr:adenylyl-sulfate kinase [Peribacillus frigoritolerans]MCY9002308.1 adenylyl-sulfate kinase [Peribacillus frigoritolerans]MED4635563.1 adenylyl-sulfate kinase [Peribacillus frigoritolerans]